MALPYLGIIRLTKNTSQYIIVKTTTQQNQTKHPTTKVCFYTKMTLHTPPPHPPTPPENSTFSLREGFKKKKKKSLEFSKAHLTPASQVTFGRRYEKKNALK